jgi:hypothetical protein
MQLLLVVMTARRMRGPALAALLAISCQRNLMPLGPSPSGTSLMSRASRSDEDAI